MSWSAVGPIVGIIGAAIGILGFITNRRAASVLSARVEGESHLAADGDWRVTRFRVAGANAEHWTATSVHTVDDNTEIAPWVPTGEDDGFGNPFYGPGTWTTYLKLSDHPAAEGIVTKPGDEDVAVVFTLTAKSDPTIAKGVPYVVTAR